MSHDFRNCCGAGRIGRQVIRCVNDKWCRINRSRTYANVGSVYRPDLKAVCRAIDQAGHRVSSRGVIRSHHLGPRSPVVRAVFDVVGGNPATIAGNAWRGPGERHLLVASGGQKRCWGAGHAGPCRAR